jgi:ABC-type sugar transport system permease subunit
VSTPSVPQRSQWGGGQPTATMPPVSDRATARRPAPSAVAKARKARLVLARVDPWSVMKLAFLLSIALAVVMFVAVTVLWSVLDSMGVFDSVGQTVESVTRSSDNAQGVDIFSYIGFSRVLTLTALLSAVNVILMTALGTLGAFLYNLAASLVGGMHVTLTEDV